MHDALARNFFYDDGPDKEIVDLEDKHPPPPRAAAGAPVVLPRVRTEDLTVHVQLDDGWHRLHASTVKTACAAPVDVRFVIAMRPGAVTEHPLARCECWTTAERKEADDHWRAKFGVSFK